MKVSLDFLRMFGAKRGDTIVVRFPGGTFINGEKVSSLTPDELERMQYHEFGADPVRMELEQFDPYGQLGKGQEL